MSAAPDLLFFTVMIMPSGELWLSVEIDDTLQVGTVCPDWLTFLAEFNLMLPPPADVRLVLRITDLDSEILRTTTTSDTRH